MRTENMTADMAFECLLVSQDPGFITVINSNLANLAISTHLCETPERALDHLLEGSTDLVIVDWKRDFQDLLRQIDRSGRRKPTVMVVSEVPMFTAGTYVLLRKPITAESCARAIKQAYALLVQDHRRHKRWALAISLIAKNQYGRSLPIVITNIGEGGLGLSTSEFLSRGDLLSFSAPLSGMEAPITIEARVLWMRQYGAAGCEFASISEADRGRLKHWLEQKFRIKKPLVDWELGND
jgi:CheY-like chemotaxis protein